MYILIWYSAEWKILSVWWTIFTHQRIQIYFQRVLYNYAPLIWHEFHFVWLTASHERSPIEGIGYGLRLSDPFTSSENFNFFYIILLIRIVCPINGVLLMDGNFWKGNYRSDEWTFSPINGLESVNGKQFSLCGIPTNLSFAHRDWLRFRIWITYEWRNGLQVGHKWILYRSHMSHRTVTYGSLMVIGWVTDESHVGPTFKHMDLKWTTNLSHMSHALVTLLRITFIIFFFKLTNLWPCHKPATLLMRRKYNFRPIRKK